MRRLEDTRDIRWRDLRIAEIYSEEIRGHMR